MSVYIEFSCLAAFECTSLQACRIEHGASPLMGSFGMGRNAQSNSL